VTVSSDDDLTGLRQIGRECMEAAGARSAPEMAYAFPGATCISVN
jgi:methionyl aminopeptidase